jgi:Ca2+-binding RTX toxin-like protein
VEQANAGMDQVYSRISWTLGANLENLTLLGNKAINGTGNELNNTLVGNRRANVLTGGAGDDTYVVGAGDIVVEQANEGIDTVQSAVSWTLGANLENLTLLGTGAIDGTGNSLNNTLIGNSAANVLTGGAGHDTYIVGTGDIVVEQANEGIDLVLSAVTWTLGDNIERLTLKGTGAIDGTGNSLNNTLIGNSAANVLTGGAGHDTYIVGTGDTVVELANEGIDLVLSDATWTLGDNIERLTLKGTEAIDGTGNSLSNILTGNSAANVLTGGAGNDTYVVGLDDTVVEQANEGIDLVLSDATWTLGDNIERLTLKGTGAIDGTGNSLSNILTGNSAANVLTGGVGNDMLVGGLGNDTYVVNQGEGQDTISENDGTVGNSDSLLYGATINPLDLVLSQQANNLRIAIHGSTDSVTIQNWFSAPTTAQVETIQAGNGQTLLSTQVDQLIQAMASFSQQTGLTWDQAIDQQPQQVQAVLAASWQ